MSNNNNSVRMGGVGFFGLLGLLFIALKLTGVISWSWWWVLLPLYAPLGLALGVFLVALVAIVLFAIFSK